MFWKFRCVCSEPSSYFGGTCFTCFRPLYYFWDRARVFSGVHESVLIPLYYGWRLIGDIQRELVWDDYSAGMTLGVS